MFSEFCLENKENSVEVENFVDDKIEVALINGQMDNSILIKEDLLEQLTKKIGNCESIKITCAEAKSDWILFDFDNESPKIQAFNKSTNSLNQVVLDKKSINKVKEKIESFII